ncbi:hypothetical protein CCACVL1_02289 [Corchorus capsularis]|uniref:RNase H type-1 domain-containing protein n=1 Tax=Corchorus capsularis TaxID=210143 RepID=A0A1R3K9G2_COCAP|nr:hypothetical protein CCACVL1_02289 [Corchorus capsularis]
MDLKAFEFVLAPPKFQIPKFPKFKSVRFLLNLSELTIAFLVVTSDEVMGKEHPGRVRGFGLGPTQTELSGLSSRYYQALDAENNEEVVKLREQLEATTNKVVVLEEKADKVSELEVQVASLLKGSGCAGGLGAVLRNGAGEVVCAGVMKHHYVLDVLTAEVRAIFFGLQMAINQGASYV